MSMLFYYEGIANIFNIWQVFETLKIEYFRIS